MKSAEFEVIELLEKIICSMKLKVFVKYKENLNGLTVEFVGADAAKVIGKHGELLDSLQIIINAASTFKVELDALDYRRRRKVVLRRLAKSKAREAFLLRKEIVLNAMSRADRKVVHETLKNNPKVESRSVGVEPFRRIIISPKLDV